MKSKLFTLLLILSIVAPAFANSPKTTFHLQNREGEWILETQVPRSQIDKIIQKYYKGRNLDPVFVNEYKAHISSYTLSHLTILNLDGLNIGPTDCEVKMGNKQVDLKMKISEPGIDFSELIISLNFMSEFENHQNRLIIQDEGKLSETLLSVENNYTLIASLAQEDGSTFLGLTLLTWLWILIPAAIFVFIMTFGFNIYENYLTRHSEFS
ncbi:hypothetical protein [Reichenbachiella ulvae]|uniref:Uncharacterized protein n=1 Tax=Reichenbachiella ulvae TaxID=2980104 RepID=A0ABT3CX60_9BACT|nr:hypothetical protein [Reichenbachiella ulvae]MCV9388287.1 hypothetical protein [Reichenbachiella ulvae]